MREEYPVWGIERDCGELWEIGAPHSMYPPMCMTTISSAPSAEPKLSTNCDILEDVKSQKHSTRWRHQPMEAHLVFIVSGEPQHATFREEKRQLFAQPGRAWLNLLVIDE
eukprot:358559-Amphidinium_carterae.2